jgi:hypothetical protein
MAAVAPTAQNTSDAISGLALQFLSAKADKEHIRSKCLRNMKFQTVIIIASSPPAKRDSKNYPRVM